MAIGRPSAYNVEIAKAICAEIVDGKSVASIGEMDGMPSRRCIFDWLSKHEDFQHLYAQAKEHQMEIMAEEILEIADNSTGDYTTTECEDGASTKKANHEHIHRSKLRVDTRKWLMSKLKMRRYGDRLQHTGPGGDSPVQTESKITVDQTPAEAYMTMMAGE